jgi:dolichol kinase
MIFFFAGVLLVIKLFPKDIALASIMVLTFGDSISHLVGERFGRIKNIFNGRSRKLFEGTIAGTLAGFFAAVFFVPVPEAFLGSAVAMIAEVIQIDLNHYPLDDNLFVPLAAGTVMFLVRIYI